MTKDITPHKATDMVMTLMNMYATELRLSGYEELLKTNLATAELARRHQDPMALHRAATVRPYVLWSKYKEVYNVHPHMSAALGKLKSDTKIPASILRNLRHPNPFFVFGGGEGIPITHADLKQGNAIGMFVTGAVSMAYPQANGSKVIIEGLSPQDARASLVVDTTSDIANVLRVTMVSDVRDGKGGSEGTDLMHLTIPITQEFTIDELVETVVSTGFVWGTPTHGMSGTEVKAARRNYLNELARIAISHLIYATSRTAEVGKGKDHAATFKKRNSWDPRPKPSKFHQVGWETGAAISNARRSELRNSAQVAGGGHTVMPHIRAPHLHLYRVGPGRSEVELKFLDAIKVNFDQYDGKTKTMHDVR